MTGVNDLVRYFKCMEDFQDTGQCAEDVRELARTAWHPVSDPPTEYGIEHEMVLIWHPPTESMEWCVWDAVEGIYGRNHHYQGAVWARWRDVVLLPQSTGDEA